MDFDTTELSERKKLILKSIIEAHIKLGEPVGSKYLMQEAKIPYSSATIRNEMAELEELGITVKRRWGDGVNSRTPRRAACRRSLGTGFTSIPSFNSTI